MWLLLVAINMNPNIMYYDRIIMLDVDVNKTGFLKLSHPKQGIYGSNQSDVPFTFKAT